MILDAIKSYIVKTFGIDTGTNYTFLNLAHVKYMYVNCSSTMDAPHLPGGLLELTWINFNSSMDK